MRHRLLSPVVTLAAIALILAGFTSAPVSAQSSVEYAVAIMPADHVMTDVADVRTEQRESGVIRMWITVVVADGRCDSPSCFGEASARPSAGWRVQAALAPREGTASVELPGANVSLVGLTNLCRASDAPCSLPWDGGQAIDPANGPMPTIAGIGDFSRKHSLVAAAPGFGNGVYLFTVIVDVATSHGGPQAFLEFGAGEF